MPRPPTSSSSCGATPGWSYSFLHDNGAGFVVDQVVNQNGPRGLGLLGMQERVEALTLQITLPVDPGEVSSGADGAWADLSLSASTGLRETGVRDAAWTSSYPPWPGISARLLSD